jgi:pimeloyl-ACP methyl ester carboxylesterase
LSLPVLVVWGCEDRWIPAARAHCLADMIPGAELVLVPGAGHLIQHDAPAALAAELQRWLGRR